jgi:hypothetical protein
VPNASQRARDMRVFLSLVVATEEVADMRSAAPERRGFLY